MNQVSSSVSSDPGLLICHFFLCSVQCMHAVEYERSFISLKTYFLVHFVPKSLLCLHKNLYLWQIARFQWFRQKEPVRRTLWLRAL